MTDISEVGSTRVIMARQIGNCGACSKPLYVTTTCCPNRRFSGGHPTPRMPGEPPCPVEDGTLKAEIDALSVSEERTHAELITGGVSGGRSLDVACPFERAIDRMLGPQMRENVSFCRDVWSALTNMIWASAEKEVTYSFRAAGDLVAAVLGEGDYLDWYCSAPAGFVSDEIATAMAAAGWSARHG